MRKALLLSAIAALSLFSCKKESSAPPKNNVKLYKVTFDASDFSQTITGLNNGKLQVNGLTTDAVNIGTYTSVLGFKIFSGNILVRQDNQYASRVTNYGIIVDSLAAGTYTAEIAAGQNGMFMSNGNGPLDAIVYSPGGFTPWNSDTFYNQFQFTVTTGPVNQTVTLNRIVANLEVDFTGTIPANASRVDMHLNQEDFEYLTLSGKPALPDTVTYHFTVPAAVKGTTAYTLSHLVLNTATPFSVILTAYDSSNAVIATHTVTNVTCHANQRTILTGSFANQATSSNSGFSITVNPNWGAPSTVHY